MYKAEIVGKGHIRARAVADSIYDGKRITTLELKYPRFIHSEFMTHRVFSRNASSSRAIPIQKMLDQVADQPAMPIFWGQNQAGMQAAKEVEYPEGVKLDWINASASARVRAEILMQSGLHKQIVNRLLEPFQFINVVVTSTEWDNFFALRDHPAAQPEIQELARVIKLVMEWSIPKSLSVGQWHLPYVDESSDIEKAVAYLQNGSQWAPHYKSIDEVLLKASTARCARVSYLNHDKTNPSIEDDLELYSALVVRPYTMKNGMVLSDNDPIHASPAEHQATPMPLNVGQWPNWVEGITHVDRAGSFWSGNLKNWIQHRQLIQGAN